jgi:hypothetical protein
MREADERQHRELGELGAAPREDATEAMADRTQFATTGKVPPVAETQQIRPPTASERAYDEVPLGPGQGWPKLLLDFFAKFPAAARQISKQPSTCKFVKECEAQGAKFGGYAEEGPGAKAWPYTSIDTVFVPMSHTDPFQAMSDFLFELNNAVRGDRFRAIHIAAVKGGRGNQGGIDAKTYARRTVDLEVEGMLKTAEVWLAAKKEAGKEGDATWAANDTHFYVKQYELYKAGKVSKEQIATNVLKSVYPEGTDAGMTVEEFYMKQYEKWAKPIDKPELMQP